LDWANNAQVRLFHPTLAGVRATDVSLLVPPADPGSDPLWVLWHIDGHRWQTIDGHTEELVWPSSIVDLDGDGVPELLMEEAYGRGSARTLFRFRGHYRGTDLPEPHTACGC
jgi:hypothetical protein